MPQRSRRTVSRGTRRKFIWARHDVANQSTNQIFGSDLLSQFETLYGAQLIGCTVVRIRGTMWATSEGGVGTTNTARIGVRVESGTGLDLSVALPVASGPFTDDSADWMLWEPFTNTIGPSGQYPHTLIGRTIDVRSSRKIDELGMRLIGVFGPNPAAPTIEWSYGWDLSIGVKLP